MKSLPNGGKPGTSGNGEETATRTAREQTLLDELIEASGDAVDLFKALAQGYTYAVRRTGAAAKERLTQREGDLLVARLELQAEGLAERVNKLAKGWRSNR